MNDYYTELANRDKATKPIKIIGVEEISCRCPNDNYEVGETSTVETNMVLEKKDNGDYIPF